MTISSATPRLWAALAAALVLLTIPDCCLIGRHAQGAHMATLGPICRALR